MTQLFERPAASRQIELDHEPRPRGWNANNHSDQLKLHTYLDEAGKELLAEEWTGGGAGAIDLVVGLPKTTSLQRGGHDLDNYLLPLAGYFGASRIGAAFGGKSHQQGSSVAVALAAPASKTIGPAQLSTRMSMSATLASWAETINRACRSAVIEPLSPGPVGVRLQFGVSRTRNWASLLHRSIDDSLGHDVVVRAWWWRDGRP
ncbi:hypothetical protein ACQP2E_16130 [Actinoplanes sp. CA-015351]|uniref:hypothetical protein n=1 Tax=Actinoplanes sp. CA-015351 TaxID=3239897 RepID=UPI003D97BD1B